jgi:hypothetical protein
MVRLIVLALVGGLAAGTGWLVASAAPGWAPPPSNWASAVVSAPASLRDAVPIGLEEGLSLYACRASLDDNTEIGRFRKDFGGCHIGYDGKEVEVETFQVLGAVWVDGAGGASSPLIAGSTLVAESTPINTRPVFVCRADFHGATHVGSAEPNRSGCTFGFGGQVITSENYSVLQAAPWMTWSAAMPGSLPADAVVGGEEGKEPFLICRAATKQGLIAGKIKASAPGCSVPSEGAEVVERIFEVLVPRWQVSNGGAIPVAGVTGGYDRASLLYPCRAKHRGTVQPGRANDALGGCHVGMHSTEISLRDYEILVQ